MSNINVKNHNTTNIIFSVHSYNKIVMKKPIQRICKNCRLFDPRNSECSVTILHAGQQLKLPVDPEDPCFFEQEYRDPFTGEVSTFNEIKQIRAWVEDAKGNHIDGNGIVKIEMPAEVGFVGVGELGMSRTIEVEEEEPKPIKKIEITDCWKVRGKKAKNPGSNQSE